MNESGTNTYITKSAQEFYNQLFNLSDLENKSLTDTTMTLNNTTATIV